MSEKNNVETPLENTENTTIRDFITQTEAVYKGMGLPALYGVLSILAHKSVFFLGGRGTGKTRTIKCLPDIQGTLVSKWDAFTLGELDILCQQNVDDSNCVHHKDFVFKVGDFSNLSEYHREVFLTVCSSISSDGEYHHITTTLPHLNIENCRLTMLIAIQPRIYSRLCNYYTQWESMSYDRFSKFLFLNPLRNGNTVDEDFVPTLAQKIPLVASLPDTINLNSLVGMFQEQVSEGRARLYARDYATAMARFQGKPTVGQDDVDTFYKLFSPYLESFSKLQTREDIEDTVTVSSGNIELLTQIGKHLEGITKEQLAESMLLTTRHIERGLAFLEGHGLVRKEEDGYHLSTELEQFFKWYKDTFSVQMSPTQPKNESDSASPEKGT